MVGLPQARQMMALRWYCLLIGLAWGSNVCDDVAALQISKVVRVSDGRVTQENLVFVLDSTNHRPLRITALIIPKQVSLLKEGTLGGK